MDEKVRTFPVGGNRFSSANQPDHAYRGERQRAFRQMRDIGIEAADKLGGVAMLMEMWHGNPKYAQLPPALAAKLHAEDRRCVLNWMKALLPVEVQGEMSASITVRVVTQLQALAEDEQPAP